MVESGVDVVEDVEVFFSTERKQSNRQQKGNKPTVIQCGRRLHRLFDDPRLLQQVLRYLRPDDGPRWRELHLQVLPKATGVVVDGRAGVPEGFHQRVHLQDLLTQRPIVCLSGERGHILSLTSYSVCP